MKKAQTALEFIMTYSWAFIIISIFVVSVVILSDTRAPVTYLGSSCNIQPLLPCAESLLAYNSVTSLQYYVVFSNELDQVMYFPPNSINISESNGGSGLTAYSTGNCTPSFASQGSTILCSAFVGGLGATTPKPGVQEIVQFTLNYRLCSTANTINCAIGIYKSSGFSVQTTTPSTVRFDNVTFITNPNNGIIVLNGVNYYNGTWAYLPTGNYVLYAQPQTGYSAITWSINSPGGSTLSATSTQNTVLTLNSMATVKATSHN